MSLESTEKRNRVAANLASIKREINTTASQVQATGAGVLASLNALGASIQDDESFNQSDIDDINATKALLVSTVTNVATALQSQANSE